MSVLTGWDGKLRARVALLAYAKRSYAYWHKRLHNAKPGTAERRHANVMAVKAKARLDLRERQVAEARRVIARHTPKPLRVRAYEVAAKQVGVMETGGNNQGTPLARYERPNGATGPEPWCGDFQAYCYRQAGSKAVTRLWASVFYLGRIAGLHKVSTPERGDLVRYTFDHVGMFVRDRGAYIETIEGNTGASGAVSDSSTGGDGVYRKLRSKSLVQDYLRVER